jgi:hypothetical protein
MTGSFVADFNIASKMFLHLIIEKVCPVNLRCHVKFIVEVKQLANLMVDQQI